jgi:hypothetical protein
MSLVTEGSGIDGFETITIPAQPGVPDSAHAAVLRRNSPRPTRRAVLYLCCAAKGAASDLVSWYTERGFQFYAADLRPASEVAAAVGEQRRPTREQCFTGLDAACQYLRESEAIDSIILAAHGADAGVAAHWCAARGEQCPVDAAILTCPQFGRRRRALSIRCPVLVMTPAPDGSRPAAPRLRRGMRDRRDARALGQHVTWLCLASGLRGAEREDRRPLFDEMGRWLGAYMYGQVRDQLL